MGSSFHRNTKTFNSAGVIAEFTKVKFDADGVRVIACGLNERSIGIAQTSTDAANQAVEVALPGGGAKLKLGGTAAAGKLLTSDASGQGTVADAAGEWCSALSYEDGVANDVVEVMVIATQAQASDA